MLTSSRLRAVNAVAAAGTFAGAARLLGVSQPAVTQQVRDLEAAFSVTLFERRGQLLIATALCEEFCAIAEQIESMEERAARILSRQKSLDEAVLRVGMGNSMPGMALLGLFQRRHPSVRVTVELGAHDQIVKAVLGRRVDIGILPNVPEDGRFLRAVCLYQEVVAIAHPGHEIAVRDRVSLEELMRHRLIFRTKGSSTRAVVDRAFRRAGLAPVPAIVLDTRDGVYEAVAHDLGVGFMWRHGTGRADAIRRIPIAGLDQKFEEVAFRLDEPADAVTDAFFAAVDRFRIARAVA